MSAENGAGAVLPADAVTAVTQAIESAVKPLKETIERQGKELAELAKPAANVEKLFGGAPAIRQGEDPLSSRGYSYARLIGLRQGFLNADAAKVEVDVHNRLHKIYVEQGSLTLDSGRSVLAPLGAEMIVDQTGDAKFAEEVGQLVQQGLRGFCNDGIRSVARQAYAGDMVRQAMATFDDTGLGVLLGPTQRGEMIELIRNAEVFSRVGATQLTLPPNGRLQFDRQTGATTAYWVGEVPSDKSSPAITASEATTGSMTLQAKKLATLAKLPNELIRFATPDIEAFIRMDMARQMALAADLAMLQGAGGYAIKGLITYPGIVTHTNLGAATNGDTFTPQDVFALFADIEDGNHDVDDPSAAFIMRPRMWLNIQNRRADAAAAGDKAGRFIFDERASLANGGISTLGGKRVVRSNQVPNNRVKGSSSNLTYILFGLFRHWIIGRVGVMEFSSTSQGDTAFTTDQTWVKAIQHMDAGPRYQNAFVLADSLSQTAGV